MIIKKIQITLPVLTGNEMFQEAGRDLHYGGSSPSHDWSFEQFCSQFTELDLWLTSIQETIYSKEENVTDRNLRLVYIY